MNKKGLSDVVTTVLIILLVVAAVGIVWAFIAPMIKNTGGSVSKGQICLTNSVEVLSCTKVNAGGNSAYNVAFRPNLGEDVRLNTTKVSLEYADGSVSEVTLNGDIASGQAISALILSSTTALKAKVSPLFLLADGTYKSCDSSEVGCTLSSDPSSPGTLVTTTNIPVGPGASVNIQSGTITVTRESNIPAINMQVFNYDGVDATTLIGSCTLSSANTVCTFNNLPLDKSYFITNPTGLGSWAGCTSLSLPNCIVSLTSGNPNKALTL